MQRRWLRGRRAKEAEPDPDPTPVSTSSVTVIDAAAVGEEEARRWLAAAPDETLHDAVEVLNGVLHAQRVAAADPSVREVALEGALVARLGYGTGEQVADGRFTEATEVPPARRERRRRVAALRPQERLAALLSGRDEALACEDLALRARTDLDAGRTREAALQLRVALEAGIAELEASGRASDMAERVGELREQREAVGEAANAALRGPLGEAHRQAVEHALGRLEAALRARTAAGGFE